jgi:hypothetical protein
MHALPTWRFSFKELSACSKNTNGARTKLYITKIFLVIKVDKMLGQYLINQNILHLTQLENMFLLKLYLCFFFMGLLASTTL